MGGALLDRVGPGALRVLTATAVLLFLLQAVRVLFSVLFGLIYDVVFAETMSVGALGVIAGGVMGAFLLPLAAPLGRGRRLLLATALVAALARVPLTVNQPTLRLWSSLLIVAAATVYAAALLYRHPGSFASALMAACAADQFLRAAGNTYDVSLRAWWLPLQALISLVICATAWLAASRSQPWAGDGAGDGLDIPSGLALGTLLFLETSLLGFPNMLARWTGADYAIVAPLLMAATLLALLPSEQWGGLALLTVTLLLGGLTGQPLEQLGTLTPMLLAQLVFLSASRTLALPSPSGHPRLSLVLGMLLFLLLNVVLALAFTYAYTLPFLRDKGNYVFLFAILALLIPGIGARSSARGGSTRELGRLGWAGAAVILALTAVFAYPPRLRPPEAGSGPFRVASYNMHYGYDSGWRFSLEEQARAIESSRADIVMLQEVDAGRITSYGVDDALWLGRRLGMEPVFGPALEDLSGVALLSRFPVVQADTELLTSRLEQTAMVSAEVEVAGQTLNAYATWLGLEPEERARQLDDALTIIGDAAPAVFGGDFNAPPGSPTYDAIRAAGLSDPFIVGDFDAPPTSPAIAPAERIDFVWTRGLTVRDAEVLDSLASDHRLVVVEVAFDRALAP